MSRTQPKTPKSKRQADDKLDEALKDTFPASDPVSLTEPAPEEPRKKDKRKPASR
jgi:hypothetical protein